MLCARSSCRAVSAQSEYHRKAECTPRFQRHGGCRCKSATSNIFAGIHRAATGYNSGSATYIDSDSEFHEEEFLLNGPDRKNHWGWKLFQLSVWIGFIIFAIHIEMQGGIAIGVAGGMIAWYATGIANGFLLAGRRLLGLPTPPKPLRNVGQLDAWAQASGLTDRRERARLKALDRQRRG